MKENRRPSVSAECDADGSELYEPIGQLSRDRSVPIEKLNKLYENFPRVISFGEFQVFGSDTNVLINDTVPPNSPYLWLDSSQMDSEGEAIGDDDALVWMRQLTSDLEDSGVSPALPPIRRLVFWEARYLVNRMAAVLLNELDDWPSRAIVPMTGCGVYFAKLLQVLLDDIDFSIPIIDAQNFDLQSRLRPIIVDDVLKTGETIDREIPDPITSMQTCVFAVGAMSYLTTADLKSGRRYGHLRQLTYQGQKICPGVVYGGLGLQSPGAVPLNSMSTIMRGDEKSKTVVESLDQKYFGGRLSRLPLKR